MQGQVIRAPMCAKSHHQLTKTTGWNMSSGQRMKQHSKTSPGTASQGQHREFPDEK